MNDSNLNIIRNALRDLGARFEKSRYGDIEFARVDSGTISYPCLFTGAGAGRQLRSVYATPQKGRGFSVPVAKIGTVDLALRRGYA